MNASAFCPFSPYLQSKIETLSVLKNPIRLGRVNFGSPLILAPMAGVTSIPFRLLMQDLGSGGAITELISTNGINNKNRRTLKMLKLDPNENNTGIQLFGENIKALVEACQIAQDFGPQFLDINMGCPVRKVVSKGAGSALLKNPTYLIGLFREIKRATNLPVTIKMRIGWSQSSINGDKIVELAQNEGIEFVTIHGRTREQQYQGVVNWPFIENIAQKSSIPIVGNGDLHCARSVQDRLKNTHCQALMLGRGPLKDPFIFLKGLSTDSRDQKEIIFTPSDCLEVIRRLLHYTINFTDHKIICLNQMKKHIVWFATGIRGVTQFRQQIFAQKDIATVMDLTEDFFSSAQN